MVLLCWSVGRTITSNKVDFYFFQILMRGSKVKCKSPCETYLDKAWDFQSVVLVAINKAKILHWDQLWGCQYEDSWEGARSILGFCPINKHQTHPGSWTTSIRIAIFYFWLRDQLPISQWFMTTPAHYTYKNLKLFC